MGFNNTFFGRKITQLLCAGIFVFGFFVLSSGHAEAASRYWVKTGAAGNWSSTANWSTTSGGAGGSSVPGSADTAFFDGGGTANANLDTAVSVAGVNIATLYSGTITQNSGITVTVGATGWTQAGGTFTSASSAGAAITISGNYLQSGGTFTSTSGTLTLGTTNTNTYLAASSTPTATFTHNSGTVQFNSGYSGGAKTATIDFGNQSLNNVTLYNTAGAVASIYTTVFSITGTLTVAGNLTADQADTTYYNDYVYINGGTINVAGNFTANATNTGSGGTINFNGSGAQSIAIGTGITVTCACTAQMPNITVNKSANTLSLGTAYAYNMYILTLTAGTFSIGSATSLTTTGYSQAGGTFSASTIPLTFTNWQQTGGTFTSTSGTLTLGSATASTYLGASSTPTATFNHNSGIVQFTVGYSSSYKTATIDFGNQSLNNVTLYSGNGVVASAYGGYFSITGTLTVAGNLTADQGDTTYYNDYVFITGGTINVAGNYVLNAYNGGALSTGTINFNGSGAQSITVGAGLIGVGGATNMPNITVNKSANTLSLGTVYAYTMNALTLTAGTFSVGSATSLTTTGYSQAAGTFSASTIPLTFNGSFQQSGGTFVSTSGTLTMGTAAAVNYYYAASSTPTATFTHNSGTVQFGGYFSQIATVDFGNQSLNNVILYSTAASSATVRTATFTITNTLNVAGNLTIDQADITYLNDYITINTGTIAIAGNVIGNATASLGSAAITLNGSGNQTISGAYNPFPNASGSSLTINKSGGTVTASSAIAYTVGTFFQKAGNSDWSTATALTVSYGGFQLASGTATSTAGTLLLGSGMTTGYNSFTASSTPTAVFKPNGGTVQANCYASVSCVIDAGNQTLNNLSLVNSRGVNATAFTTTFAVTGTLNVSGTLTFSQTDTGNYSNDTVTVNNAFNVGGDFIGGANALGSATITFNGTGTQTISNSAYTNASAATLKFPTGSVTINKASGSVVLAANVTLNAASQNLTVTSGTLDLAGYNLTVNGTSATFTVASGATLKMTGSEVITTNATYPSFASGATALYYGSSSTNLAISKSVTCDSLASAIHPCAAAVDGNTGTYWQTSSTVDGYTIVDLGVGQPVNQVVFNPVFGDATVSYTIFTSPDNVTYTQQGAAIPWTASNIDYTQTFTAVAGTRYVKVYTTNPTSAAWYASAYEIRVYASTPAFTVQNYSYSNLTINGSSATFSPAANITVGGDLTVSAGTLDLGAYTADRSTAGGTLSVASGATLKIGGTGTFPANYTTNTLNAASTVEYSSASAQTIAAQNYGNLTSSSTGARTLASSGTIGVAGTFTAGSNTYTVTGSTVSFNGTGAQTITGGTFNALTVAKSAGTATATGNITAASLTVNGAGGTLDLGAGLTHTVSGTVTVTAGTLNGNTSTLNVGGDFLNTGTFTAGTGTVVFNNNTLNSTQTISGSNTFNNLTKNSTATTTLAFTAGTTQTISGTMTLQGTNVSNGLLLRSTTPGTAWNITPNGTRTITWLDVKDSNNTLSGNKIDCTGLSCTDSGNNTNWIFGLAGEFDPNYPTTGDGGVSASTTSDITNANWGKVPVIYNIKDVNAGVNPAGTVNPSFEYSTNNGTTWTSIVNSRELDASATSTQNLTSKTVYYPHYATWTASTTVPGIYSTQGRVRVTIADADTPSNRSVSATSTQFIIDTKAPVATGSPLLINGSNSASVSSDTVSVTISSGLSDDSQVRIQLSNDGTTWYGANSNMTIGASGSYGTATTTGTTLGPWTWTLAGSSRTRTLYAKVTDIYYNVIASNMTATATQNASPVVASVTTPSINGSGALSLTYTLSDPDSTNTPADTTATTTLMTDLGVTASAVGTTGGTSVTVSGTNNTAIAANDIVQIDTEMMLVSANTSGTLTVTRGYGGTTAATHSASAAVWVMAKTPTGSVCTNATFRAGTCTPTAFGSGIAASWTPSTDFSGYYYATAKVRITANDGRAINQVGTGDSATFIFDTKKPAAGASQLLINGSNAAQLTSNTVTLTISSGLSDDAQMYIQFATSSSPYVWRGGKNDGTVDLTAGSTGTATTTASGILGPWTLNLYSTSRTKTVYARVTDVYGNVITSDFTATATQNNAPVATITNSPSLGLASSVSPGVISTTFTVSDADSTATPADTTATTTLMYDVGVTASGAISSTSATSVTVTGSNNTVIGANDIIQIDTEMMLVSANASGTLTVTRGYGGTTAATHSNTATVWVMAKTPTGSACANATFRAGTCTPVTNASGPFTATWTPANDISVYYASAKVRITANDGRTVNQVGTSDSGTFEIDTIKPVNASPSLTFDAGIAGTASSASISINSPTDATGTQYMLSALNTAGVSTGTAWTTISANPTAVSWGFDSGIGTKSVNIKFRDVYGNEQVSTTTVTTLNPPATASFLVQDVSKVTTSDWKLYIGWEAATSTSFASYKLEYATSTDNITYSNYADVTVITDKTINYYVHSGLTTTWYYRYRVGVKDTNGNTTVRSNAYINAKPDGIQNLGEGGGGTSAAASVVTNTVPTENSDGTVSVTYKLTDGSYSLKTSPSYEAYVLYDVGATLTSSSTSTLILSDTTKLPSSGWIQLNNEIIKYTGNATSTGTLSGITRGTWPTLGTTRTTRMNTTMLAGIPAWVVATSTDTTITGLSSSATSTTGTITWATSNDTNLAGNYLTNVGIRVLVHDNQSSSSAPLSTQSDLSDSGMLAILDLKAPTLTSTSLLINGSSSTVEASSTSATLTVTGITGDTSNESIQVQFATSTPAVWRGANSDGTITMTPGSWGTATSTASIVGSWSWPLSSRSETITVRIKDAYGNISNTDTNSNSKNAVPEFNGTQTDADASGYATSTNSSIVIRQCNVFDTDSLCTTGKVKVKFQVRDADTAQGTVTPGYVTTAFATSLNSGAYATSTIVTYSNGLVDVTAGKSTVNADGTTFTTVTAYYDPGLSSSATMTARIAVTDSEPGTALQWATSNTINYDKVNPSGSITFDAGTAGTASSATITVPVPTDATTTQYMISATSTAGTLSTYGWTTLTSAASLSHGFDSPIEGKTVYYRFRDMFGNTSGTSTVTSLLPPLASTLSVQDISKTSSSTWRTFISWQASTSTSFSLYRIEYATSTDNTTYSAFSDLITIPTISTNYYLHSGLSNTMYYRYRLSMKNTSGNYSVKSSAYFAAKPDGTLNLDETSADDTTPPSVNTVTSTGVKATSATVTFNSTDNASLAMNSSVYYAAQADFTTNVNASKTGRDKYVYKFGNPSYVVVGSVGATAAHSVGLANLTKNLTYRYGVEVCDATGNCTFDDSSGAGYTFTTSNGPAIVGGSIVATPSFDSAVITWKTDKPADGQVFYATSSAAVSANPTIIGSSTQITSADGNGQYVHTFTISNLTFSATYYYKVRSTDQNSSSNSYTQYDESAVTSFTTTTQTPPTITVAATCSTTDSTAIVSWTTDQVSTTEISVLTSNTPSNYFSYVAGAQLAQYPGSSTVNSDATWTSWRSSADYVTSHSNTFTGLTESTTYYAKVRSLNRSGGEVSSTLTCATIAKQTTILARPATITDTTPPIISSVIIKDIKGTSVTIAWQTDELADSLVKYGKTSNYGSLNGSEELSSDHTVTLSGLTPQTTYNFKITSADAYGNRAYAGDQTFTTITIGDEAVTTKEQLQALQKELQDLKDKADNATKKSQSLAEAVARFKEILKSVSTDVSLQDLESLTTDITDTITDITQQVTPPNILGGVPQVEVESDKATVTWRTNKLSTSIIALVPASEYDAKAKDPYTVQVGQPQDDVTNHVVVIPNLHAATTYHFQIRSKAKVGPEGKSRDFVFETKPELPVILDYSFKNISEKSITVAWKTNVVSTSQIKYTPFVGGRLDEKQSKTEGKSDFNTSHEVTTTNMTPNTDFQIEISSADISGGVASKIIGTIKTTVDVKPPVISKVRSESTLFPGKVEKTQTIIYWETDEPSTSQIFWKEGVAKGDLTSSSREDKELTTNHVVVLTSFTPGSVYRFQVESTDASGNKGRSSDYTLLTSKQGQTVIDLIITNFQDIFGFVKKL